MVHNLLPQCRRQRGRVDFRHSVSSFTRQINVWNAHRRSMPWPTAPPHHRSLHKIFFRDMDLWVFQGSGLPVLRAPAGMPFVTLFSRHLFFSLFDGVGYGLASVSARF